jgi:hypothetical protein
MGHESTRKQVCDLCPHRFTLPQLAACVLLMFYVNKSYRDMEEWLLASDRICQVLDLKHVPDHTTLMRTIKKLRKADLDGMNRRLLTRMEVSEPHVALDTTGFAPSQASAYYQTRRGRRWRTFFKGVYAVGTRSQFILAMFGGHGTRHDARWLAAVRRAVRSFVPQRAWALLADRGFDALDVRAPDFIAPMRRNGKLLAPDRIARAELVAAATLDGWFGQRWKCGTVHSVIKRKFGDVIRSRRPRLQYREPVFKGLVYNIHVCPG